MVVLATLLGIYAWQDYERTLREGHTQLLDEARTLAETADAALRAGNAVLADTRRIILDQGGIDALGEERLHRLFTRQLDIHSNQAVGIPIHAMFVVDAKGMARASSVSLPTKPVDTSDREYFRHFSNNTDDKPLLSELNISRLTNLPVVYLTLRLNDAQGRFAGVIGLSLRLQYFEDYYRRRKLHQGQVLALHRLDGKPVFRHPPHDNFPMTNVAGRPEFRQILEQGEGLFQSASPIDGVERYAAFVTSARYPFVAISSEPISDVLAGWTRNMTLAASLMLASLLALIVLLRFALQQAASALHAEAASKAKSDFLAVVSHEIRTPMNGVLSLARLLRQTPLNPEQSEYTRNIVNSAESLLTVINDILIFSRTESGQLDIISQPFAPAELLRNLAPLFQQQAEQNRLRFRVDLPEDLPPALRGDAARLRQVLVNLLGNAFKFTEHGEIRLSARSEQLSPERVRLELSVSDTGIGIPSEQHERIFAPFEQVHAGDNRRYGGSGLGLAICRRLLRRMGGDIRVSSQPGSGSTFTCELVLPTASVAELPPPQRSDRALQALPADTRILLVEDNPVNQQVAIALLKKLGLSDVRIAKDGQEALDLLGSPGSTEAGYSPDLVLMDCQMPRLDGYAATRALRTAGHSLPIIAMTAHVLSDDREKCLAAGMDDYLSKPVDLPVLHACLARWLERRPTRPGNSTPLMASPPPPPFPAPPFPSVATTPPPDQGSSPLPQDPLTGLPLFDAATLLPRFGGDTDIARRIVDVFLNESPTLLAALHSAQNSGDADLTRQNAHSLKGAAGNLAAQALFRHSADLEALAREGNLARVGQLLPELDRCYQLTRAQLEIFVAATATASA